MKTNKKGVFLHKMKVKRDIWGQNAHFFLENQSEKWLIRYYTQVKRVYSLSTVTAVKMCISGMLWPSLVGEFTRVTPWGGNTSGY